jgi:hypothetical protein
MNFTLMGRGHLELDIHGCQWGGFFFSLSLRTTKIRNGSEA